MALKTLGTLATNSLNAVQWPSMDAGGGSISDADFATINALVKDDEVSRYKAPTSEQAKGYISRDGHLYVPNRGVLKIFKGDWITVDLLSGWPMLISRRSLAATLTATGDTTNGSPNVANMSVNVLTLGWWAGMKITGTGVPASTQILSIAAGGLSIVLSKNATATNAGVTFTVNNFTHN